MSSTGQELYPIGQWIGMVADDRPDDPALIFAPQEGEDRIYSWRELDRWSNQLARLLQSNGVEEGDRVVTGLPNSPEWMALWPAIWKLGAQPVGVRAAMPPHEYNAIVEIAEPKLVVADWDGLASNVSVIRMVELVQSRSYSNDPLPTKLTRKSGTLATGGSTGTPKLIEYQNPAISGPHLTIGPGRQPLFDRLGGSLVQIICGPLYHSSPTIFSVAGFMEGSTTVLMERFDAAQTLDLIERYRPHFIHLVPAMMQRILRIPDISSRDLSSLEVVLHNAAPCPAWVKRSWIDLIGAEQVVEVYGGSEAIGETLITGEEWLKHPGSVGKPMNCELKIIDEDSNELPTGEVGLIYVRKPPEQRGISRYIGVDQMPTTDDGFMTLGDLGWLDEDGYLYIADRRTDMIVTGGANVYPAEVEAILSQAPGVADVVVIGVPDVEWGRRVHAIVQPLDAEDPPQESDLGQLCREHLASYKVPKTYEYLPELPRNAAGKIRRSALVEERSTRRVASD